MDAAKLMELMKEKKATLQRRARTLKPNPGANRYVILPGWRKGDEQVFWHEFGQHFIRNADNEIQAVYPCLKHTYDKPCPVCEGLNHAIRMTSDDATVELLQKAASSRSYLLNVLALDSDDAATPQILEVRGSVFGQIISIIEEWGMALFDENESQIVVINRDGKGLNTKYTVQISPKKHKMPAGVLSKLNDLDDYVRQESEEQQRKAISAINSVAGLLPSTPSRDTPVTPVTDSYVHEAPVAPVAPVRTSGASKAEVELDDEIDALLDGMDD